MTELRTLSSDRKRSQIAIRTPDLQLITMITMPELRCQSYREGHMMSTSKAAYPLAGFRKSHIT